MLQLPRSLFCSDFHLWGSPEEHPDIKAFFEQAPSRAEALVILGDLFECWWGDDHRCEHYHAWEKIFAALTIPCYLVRGNRDFLIGADFSARTKIILLEPGTVVQIGAKKIALFHGDEPGLQDWPYQLWRKFARRARMQSLFLTLPESLRRRIAVGWRATKTPAQKIFKELKVAIEPWLRACHTRPDLLINGHLHFPVIEEYEEGLTRYQLGCWDRGAHSFLMIDPVGLISYEHSQEVIKRCPVGH